MKQLKRERYRNMVKRINDLPDDKQMFVIGIINGMLLTEETKNETKMAEKAGQEVRNTQGYYYPQNGNEEVKTNVPTGTLQIEVSNLPEFKELLEQAKKESDQLQATISRLSSFDLKINFSAKEDVISEKQIRLFQQLSSWT